jgi:hypothetical protein
VKVVGGKFTPVWDQPGKPYVCFPRAAPDVNSPQYTSFATG